MPNLPNVSFDYDQMMQMLNLGMIVVIGLGALGGFFNGFFKSTYKFIVFVGLLLIGWFISPIIVRFMLSFDISSVYPFTFNNIQVTSLNDLIPSLGALVVPALEGAIVEGTLAFQLASELAFMVLRIVFIIIWMILMETVFRFFFWIVYLIIKPSSRDGFGKKKPKSFVSRLMGLAIGGMSAIITVFLFSILFSGIASLGTSLKDLTTTIPVDMDAPYTLVISNSGVSLRDSRRLAEGDPDFSQFEDFFRFMDEYRTTYMGKIGGYISIGDAPLDIYVFDELFSITVDDNQVKFRSELAIGIKVYQTILENTDGAINLGSILAMDEEVLTEMFEDISKLELINVAIPVGLELALKTDLLDEEIGDIASLIDLEALFDELVAVDYSSEIVSIGNALIDFGKLDINGYELIGFDLIISLDGDIVQSLLDNIGNLELINIAGEAGVEYLFSMDSIITALSNYDITKEDFDLSEIDWGQEIKNMGEVFAALKALQIDFTDMQNINFDLVTDEAINNFALALMNSNLISKNNQVLTSVAVTLLPPEYQSAITVLDLQATDLASILSLGKIVYSSGIMDDDFDPKNLLTSENIDKIADYIAQSSLISGNINGLIQFLLSYLQLPDGMVIEIDENFDWSGEAGKTELTALLNSAKIILDLGVDNPDFMQNLTEEKINSLSDAISGSQILMNNIGNIIDYFLTTVQLPEGLTIEIADMEWNSEAGKEEFTDILRIVAKLFEMGFPNVEISLITKADLDSLADLIAESDQIMGNIENVLEYFLGSLGDFEIVISQIDWTSEEGKTEVKAIFNALGTMLESGFIVIGDEHGIGVDFVNLTDQAINDLASSLSSSRILKDNLSNILEKFIADANVGITIDAFDDPELWTEQELSSLLFSARIMLTKEIPSGLFQLTEEELDYILGSSLITDAIVSLLEDYTAEGGDLYDLLIIEGVVNWKDVYDNEGNRIIDGELRKLFRSATILLGENPDFSDTTNLIDPNRILNLTDGTTDTNGDGIVDENDDDEIGELLSSMVLLKSIANQLIKLSQGETAILVVNLELSDSRWDEEIRSFLGAVKTVLGENIDLNNINIDANTLKTLTNNRGAEDDQVGDILKSIIITDTIIKTIVDLGGEQSSLVINLTVDDPRWLDSENADGEIRKLIKAISIIFATTDLNSPDIDPNIILNLTDEEIGYILSSIIASDSIIKVIYDLGQGVDSPIVINLTIDDERWYDNGENHGELRRLINAIKIILGDNPDLNNISIDANVLKNLTNERGAIDDEVGDILKSIIITDTIIKTIIDLSGDALIVNLTASDARWRDSDTADGEIRKLIKAISIIFGETDDLNNPNIDPNVILNLTDDQIADILASIIASDSIIKVIYDLGQGETAQIVINLTLTDERWYDNGEEKGELRHLISAIKIILGENPDLNNINIDANILKNLTNNRGGADDEVGEILKSIIITDTMIKTIIDLGGDALVVNLTAEDSRWRDSENTDGEIRKLIKAISVIFGESADLNNPDIDPNVLLNLSDEAIGDILASIIASDSIIKQIYDLGQGVNPVIVINLTINDERWYDNNQEAGELRRFIRAIKVILGDNPDLNNVAIDANILKNLSLGDVDPLDDDVKVIQESIIAKDTIIKKIIEISIVEEGQSATLIVNLDEDDPRWVDSETEDGEIRKLIRAIQIIFSDPLDDLNNPTFNPNIILNITDGTVDTNADGNIDELDDDDLGLVLKSIIISDTIINKLIEIGNGAGSVLVVDLPQGDQKWYDSPTEKGEVRNFVKAVEVVLAPDLLTGEIDLNNPSIKDQNDILRLSEDQITVLLRSIILSKTIVREIISNQELTIPLELQDIDALGWYDQPNQIGELHKLIKVIAIIMDEGTTNMSTDKILNMTSAQIDIILDSLIAKETIKKEIRAMEALVVDENNPAFSWDDVIVGETRTDGELRKLLASASLLIANNQVDINKILTLSTVEIDVLVSSRIIVDSAVKELKNLTGATGSLNGVLYLPDDSDVNYHGANGELKHFFIAIQDIKQANTTPEQGIEDISNISLTSLTGENQTTILASKIIKNTIIINIVNEANRVGSPLKLPAKLIEASPSYDASAWDVELPKFLDSIQVFVGSSASLTELNFTVDNFLNLTDGSVDVNSNGTIDKEEDQILTIISSEILAYTVVNEIQNEALRDGSMVIIPTSLQEEDWYGEDGELRRFLMAVSSLSSSGLQVQDSKFLNLTDSEISKIVNSQVLSYSIVKRIEDERNNATSLISLPDKFNPDSIAYNEALWYGEAGELAKTLKALRGLGMTTFDADFSIRPLFDEAKGLTPEVILASEVVERTIINKVVTEASVGGSLHQTLIIPANVVWEKTLNGVVVTDIGELRRFLTAIDIILGGGELENASFNVEKFFDDEDQVVLLASSIIEASVVNKVDSEAGVGGNLNGTLVYPSDWQHEDWYGINGELRRFLTSIELIVGNGTFETTSFEADKFLGNDRATLIASRIVEASVVEYIIDSTNPVDGALKDSLYLPVGYTTNNPNWYGVNGELNKFLDAIKIIVGPAGTYANANFEVDTILGENRSTLLASRVVEASVVEYVLDSALPGGSLATTLVIPLDLQTNNSKWYGANGELNKFLDSITIIIGPAGTYANANFTVDTILGDDQETLIDSRVVEASVINYIQTSSIGLIFPTNANPDYYYFADETIVWERTYDNDNFVTDIGELRRFLAGVSAIIGETGSFATMVFDMNSMMNTDFSVVVSSRILEATVSDMVDDMISGTLLGFINEPADGYQWFYHSTSSDITSGIIRRGEFVLTMTTNQYSDLLGFLNSIQEMDEAGLNFNNITINNIVVCDSVELATALWDYSRVMRGSIATILNEVLEPIPASPFYTKPVYTNDDFTSKQDVIDGLNELKAFMALIS